MLGTRMTWPIARGSPRSIVNACGAGAPEFHPVHVSPSAARLAFATFALAAAWSVPGGTASQLGRRAVLHEGASHAPGEPASGSVTIGTAGRAPSTSCRGDAERGAGSPAHAAARAASANTPTRPAPP